MKGTFVFIVFTILLALIESTFPRLYLFPSLVILFVLYSRTELSLTTALVGGVALDLMGVGVLGLSPLFFVVCSMSAQLIKLVFPQDLLFKFLNACISLFVYKLLLDLPGFSFNIPGDFPLFAVSILSFFVLTPVSKFIYEILEENSI